MQVVNFVPFHNTIKKTAKEVFCCCFFRKHWTQKITKIKWNTTADEGFQQAFGRWKRGEWFRSLEKSDRNAVMWGAGRQKARWLMSSNPGRTWKLKVSENSERSVEHLFMKQVLTFPPSTFSQWVTCPHTSRRQEEPHCPGRLNLSPDNGENTPSFICTHQVGE